MGYRIRYSLPAFTELLEKVRALEITNTGWKRISSTPQEPVFLNNLLTPGNYSLTHWRQGPESVTGKVPINICVNEKDGVIYQTVFYMSTIFERAYDAPSEVFGAWTQLQSLADLADDSTEPKNPSHNMIWIKNNNGIPEVLVFDAVYGKWVSAQPENMMRISVYDPDGKAVDYYQYVDNQIKASGLEDSLWDFNQHVSDGVGPIHVSTYTKQVWDAKQDLSDMLAAVTAIKEEASATIDEKVQESHTAVSAAKAAADTLQPSYDAHIANSIIHPTQTKQKEWMTSANKGHMHALESAKVKCSIENIIGVFATARFNACALERNRTVDDDAARLALESAYVQNGDSVFVKSTQMTYFVVDDTKLSYVSNKIRYPAQEAAFVRYSVRPIPFIWGNVENKPTSVAGFGIADAYTGEETDRILDNPIQAARDLDTFIENYKTDITVTKQVPVSGVPDTVAANQVTTDGYSTKVNDLMSQVGCEL